VGSHERGHRPGDETRLREPLTLRDLRLRVRALFAPRRVERELHEELDFHLEMETRKHLAAGLSPEDARARAGVRFGSTSRAAEECRDARGTAFIETCALDVMYALRGFRRAPSVAATVVGTVALGLGLVAAVFTIFSALALRVDAVQDPGALFGVAWAPSGDSSGRFMFTRRLYEALRRESDVFSDVAARRMDISTRIEGRPMEGHLVTGNFFQVLGVNPARGRLLMEDDARPGEGPVMVLSHRGWQHLTARDPNVVGRSVLINGVPFEVVGVLPEEFFGLDFLPPDFWAPLSQVTRFRPWEQAENPGNLEVIGRLKPGVSQPTARAGLVVWAAQASVGLPRSQRPEDIRLDSKRGATPLSSGVLLGFSPLFVAFGLILVIGCANVANLLLARAVSRQREIGIRLSLGASRPRVVRQLLTENLLLALASAALALGISRVVLDGAIRAVTSTMPAEIAEFLRVDAPQTDVRVIGFLIVAAVISAAFFGLLPALQATRLDLVRTMRGELAKDARPSRARNALIIVQVTASALLLICAGIFLRSATRAAAADPGMRVADTIIIEFDDRARQAIVAAVASEPSVSALAASWPGGPSLSRAKAALGSPASGATAGNSGGSPVGYRFVSSRYFSVLDIGVLRGRGFTEDEARSGTAIAVLSDATARQIWPNADPIGQLLRLEPDLDDHHREEPRLPSQTFVVVGIVRSVAGFRLGWPEAGVYLPFDLSSAKATLIARASGDPEPVRRTLLERLTKIDPNLHQMMTMRTLSSLETYPLQVGFWVTVLLGGVALILTLSGIYGVLSYLVAQRTNEIGVRIALGATTNDVTRLVLSQSLRLVTIGLAIGASLAWAGSTALMSTPIAGRLANLVDLFDGVAYIGALLFVVAASLIAAAVPAVRAARIDPATTLRQE
jgi:predicted permease